ELDMLLSPTSFYVEESAQRITLDEQVAVVQREQPELVETIYAIELRAPPGTATMMLAKPQGEGGPKDGVRIFVDPYRAKLLAVQGYRDAWMGKVYHFHRTFYLPRWGRWITSTCAILLMASVAAGVLVWSSRKPSSGSLYRWHTRVGI